MLCRNYRKRDFPVRFFAEKRISAAVRTVFHVGYERIILFFEFCRQNYILVLHYDYKFSACVRNFLFSVYEKTVGLVMLGGLQQNYNSATRHYFLVGAFVRYRAAFALLHRHGVYNVLFAGLLACEKQTRKCKCKNQCE